MSCCLPADHATTLLGPACSSSPQQTSRHKQTICLAVIHTHCQAVNAQQLSQAWHAVLAIDSGVLADISAPVTGMQLENGCLRNREEKLFTLLLLQQALH